jgi:hypothetical protein
MSSEIFAAEPPGAAKMRVWRLGGLLALAVLLGASTAHARTLLTVEEALKLVFPGCSIEHPTVYLTEAQVSRARELSDEPLEDAIVRPYRATCNGEPAGMAYLDIHRVRTLPETLMVVVSPDGRVRRVEVLSFREPLEYKPRGRWYRLFDGHRLDERLRLKRGIPIVAGATLTSRATEKAVRRVLAIDHVLREASASDQENNAR